MKEIIFVASFLSPPKKPLLYFSKCLPIKTVSSLPHSKLFHKALFLGSNASPELIELFQSTLRRLSEKLIKKRLNTILSLKFDVKVSGLPAGYIQAKSDKLVSLEKVNDFYYSFKNLSLKIVDGPNFLLQAKPQESAEAISELANIFIGRSSALKES